MARLIHISDPHLGPLPPAGLAELSSKRVLGYVNWHRNRGRAMDGDIPARLAAAIAAAEPDHIAVTGDLVNIALPAEFATGRLFLQSLGDGQHVSAVPGNHDAYVPGALGTAIRTWAEWMTGDDADEPAWPYVRRRGELAIVGLCSAVSTAPFMASGRIGARQRESLADCLAALKAEGLFRVVLIHHPLHPKACRWHKRLTDASRLRKVLAQVGAELVLHGHTHQPTQRHIAGPHGRAIPVIGISAASQGLGGHRPASGFNQFDIERHRHDWSLTLTRLDWAGPVIGYRAAEPRNLTA